MPVAFFRGLYEGVGAGFVEIRPLLESSDPRYGTPEGRAVESQARRWFAWPREIDACARHCHDLDGKLHVYYGVGLRNVIGGGKKSDVGCVTSVFADVDFKDVPRELALQKIQIFPVTPSACVRSGGGVHVYWFLKEPVYASRLGDLEETNRGILLALGAQTGPQNADRILRVPGTLNIKAAYPDPKPRCEVSWWRPANRYSFDRFQFVRPKARDLFANTPHTPRTSPEGSIASDRIRGCAQLLAPVWIPGNRHYIALHVGGWCAHAGLSLDSALELVRATCDLAHDEEASNRILAVTDSYRKFVSGDAVTGRRLFYEFLVQTFPHAVAARAAAITEILEAYMPELDVERKGCPTQKTS